MKTVSGNETFKKRREKADSIRSVTALGAPVKSLVMERFNINNKVSVTQEDL